MFRKLAVIAAGITLLGFGLSAAPASAGNDIAEISLTKTVTTEPGVCGTGSSIQVQAGTTVYYCYTVTNTGNVELNYHTLDDDQLGPLFANLEYELDAGESANTVTLGLTLETVITEDTVNVATWTACNKPPVNGAASTVQQEAPLCIERLTATATATAEVTIAIVTVDPEFRPPPADETAPAVAAAGTPRFTG